MFWRIFFFFDCILTTENCLFLFYKNTQEKIENFIAVLWKMSNIRSTQFNDNHNDELIDGLFCFGVCLSGRIFMWTLDTRFDGVPNFAIARDNFARAIIFNGIIGSLIQSSGRGRNSNLSFFIDFCFGRIFFDGIYFLL